MAIAADNSKEDIVLDNSFEVLSQDIDYWLLSVPTPNGFNLTDFMDLSNTAKEDAKEKGPARIDNLQSRLHQITKKLMANDILRVAIATAIGTIIALIILDNFSNPSPILLPDPTEFVRKNLTDSAADAESNIGNGAIYPAIAKCNASIDLYNNLPNNTNKTKLRREYSKILSIKATAYYELSKCKDKKDNLDIARKLFEEAYNYSNNAENLCNLGAIYFELSKVKDRKDNLDKSLQFLNESLRMIRDNSSIAYANTLIKRGVTLRYLSQVQNKKKHLMASIKDNELSLRIYLNSTIGNNSDYADYQLGIVRNQLSACYRLLAGVEHQKINLNKSINNNTMALELLARNKTYINDLSSVERNRCNIYISLSQVDNPLAEVDEPEYYLNKAIDNFNKISESLKECDFEQKEVKNDLALAYVLRSDIYLSSSKERQRDINNATDNYSEALAIFNKKDYPIYYQNILDNQGVAFYYSSGINKDKQYIILALNNYDEALAIQNANELRLDFADTKRNQGKAFRKLADFNFNKEINIKNAIEAYKNASKIWQEDPIPLEYAYTENLVGNAYLELSKIKDRDDNLQKAIYSYEQAFSIFNREEYPEMNEIVQRNINAAENPMW